jgi:hypothetical protein
MNVYSLGWMKDSIPSSVDFNNGEYKAEPVIYTKELRLLQVVI